VHYERLQQEKHLSINPFQALAHTDTNQTAGDEDTMKTGRAQIDQGTAATPNQRKMHHSLPLQNKSAPGVRAEAYANATTNYKEAHRSVPLKDLKISSSPGKKARTLLS